ncbi:arginase family protein [soil metagenome]
MTTVRLLFPQWQGGEPKAVDMLTPGLDVEEGRMAYGIGGQITALLAPPASGPVAVVPIGEWSDSLPAADGIVAKKEVLRQNDAAIELLRGHDADRVVTLGGSCSVSMAPFSYLADRYADDLAIVWLDGHADSNLPGGPNAGFNTMVITHLVGRGDNEVLSKLPGKVNPKNVVLAGAHGWDDQDRSNVDGWGLTLIEPTEETAFIAELVAWLKSTGCSKVAVHFDLDVIDSDEIKFGMAFEPAGLSKVTALNALIAISETLDLVGLTVAEFVPREAMVLRSLLRKLPLLSD